MGGMDAALFGTAWMRFPEAGCRHMGGMDAAFSCGMDAAAGRRGVGWQISRAAGPWPAGGLCGKTLPVRQVRAAGTGPDPLTTHLYNSTA